MIQLAKEKGSLPGLIKYHNNGMVADLTGGTDDEALLLMTGVLKKLETPQSSIPIRSTLRVVEYCTTINGIFISRFFV